MFLIQLKKEEGAIKYWTESYDDKTNMVSFETTSKDGKKITHKVNKDVIKEIQDVGDLEK